SSRPRARRRLNSSTGMVSKSIACTSLVFMVHLVLFRERSTEPLRVCWLVIKCPIPWYLKYQSTNKCPIKKASEVCATAAERRGRLDGGRELLDQRQIDLAPRHRDVLDAHAHPIAERERAPGAPPDQPHGLLVEVVEVVAQRIHLDQPLDERRLDLHEQPEAG